MPEILLPFAEKAAWDTWRGLNAPAFAAMRQSVLEAVRQTGFVEPFTSIHRHPEEIVIDPARVHESISSHELNARKRGLLLVLQAELRARGWEGRRNLRILAPEALSRAARVLRGLFPYFLGTEYLPTAEEQTRYFPVPHMDLQATGLPDASFDVFFSGDVMEHVPDPEAAWAEIRRVVKPGGLIVSSFPFDPNRGTPVTRARLDATGKVEHLTAPEYHGNPVDPAAGSLVFTLPGWDLLSRFRASGCADAAMVMVASAHHGVASDGPPGVFVLVANNGPAPAGPRPRIVAPGGLPEKLCTLVALPRSGTTLLTALFQVHSRFDAVFEPWNSKLLAGADDANLPRLLAKAGVSGTGGRYLFVKETSADPVYVGFIRRLLQQSPLPIDRSLMLLCRRPAPTFLSEIERRGQWWGNAVALDAEQFRLWCVKSRRALADMVALARTQDGLAVSYERLAEEPQLMLHRLARSIGFEVEPAQLEYEKHLDTSKVRGDVNVGSQPAAISDESIRRRAAAEHLTEQFAAESGEAAWFTAFNDLHAAVYAAGLTRIRALPLTLLDRVAAV